MAKTITFWKEQEKEPSEARQNAVIAIEDLKNKYSQRARAEFESRAQKL